MGDASNPFDLETSRRYWRFAPSGVGKHDSTELLSLSDAAFENAWNEAFSSRFRQYVEEDEFLKVMADNFRGKRVLSIGPGLGLHEIFYQAKGAQLTCCDIVESNLRAIERAASLKGLPGMSFLLSRGAQQPLGGPYDVVFIYGSLMTMPATQQRELLSQAMTALAPDGRIVLMLYTWEFAAASCGWDSPARFDPAVFARASDPSVGNEHCPWSDWHDRSKLVDLTGGAMHVAREQFWNQGWFLWAELAFGAERHTPSRFFDIEAISRSPHAVSVSLTSFAPADAKIELRDAQLIVETGNLPAGYALTTPPLQSASFPIGVNAIALDVDLQEGGLSIGILDETKNVFEMSQAAWQRGPGTHVFAVPGLPTCFRIVVSNHRPGRPGSSRFHLSRISLLRRDTVVNDRVCRQVGNSS